MVNESDRNISKALCYPFMLTWIGYADSEGEKLFRSELRMTFSTWQVANCLWNSIETPPDIFAEASLWKEATLFLGFSCAPVTNRGKAEYARNDIGKMGYNIKRRADNDKGISEKKQSKEEFFLTRRHRGVWRFRSKQ